MTMPCDDVTPRFEARRIVVAALIYGVSGALFT
jgi:hypothetical protein